ncbi:TauD/TfdA family dioxygenase [Bordetella sp. LUAb4]|uniref:TauD/TfdA family dioxygenase n=1 Tax=Bordetella sp. LUAb4 TaxID=2843195 RepID=UPI001E37CB82|nr:TauD/TfdA family dioxygenase [Bordetella sp. LUAb4]
MTLLGTQLQGPAVWKGPDIDWRTHGLHVLSPQEVAEIDAALAHLKAQGDVDFPDITPENFPLQKVGTLMRGLPQRLQDSVGFLMLRGLPRERYSDDDMAKVYFGLASYMGRPMTQSYLGDMLGHVMDVSDLEPKSRGYRKGGGQLMHTDSCDVIGLMCLRTAKSGGDSRITSALTVHNYMAEHHPEHFRVLCEGLWLKRADEDGRHATRTYSENKVPFFVEQNGRVVCYLPTGYARLCEKSGQRPYTQEESDALYRVRKVAAMPEHFLDMGFKDGDIQFLNNRSMVHGRTDYEDYPEIEQRRHLMRIWIRAKDWDAMPPRQVFHTDEDMRLWSQHRKPFAELPSVHDARLKASTADARMVD